MLSALLAPRRLHCRWAAGLQTAEPSWLWLEAACRHIPLADAQTAQTADLSSNEAVFHKD